MVLHQLKCTSGIMFSVGLVDPRTETKFTKWSASLKG